MISQSRIVPLPVHGGGSGGRGGGCRWRCGAAIRKRVFRHVLSEEALRPNRALATGSHSTTAPAGLFGPAPAFSPLGLCGRRRGRRRGLLLGGGFLGVYDVEDQFREGFGLKRAGMTPRALRSSAALLLRGRLCLLRGPAAAYPALNTKKRWLITKIKHG